MEDHLQVYNADVTLILRRGQSQTGVAFMVVDVRLQLGWGEEAFPLNHLVRARTLSLDILTSTIPHWKYESCLTSFSLSFHFSKLPKSLTPDPVMLRFFLEWLLSKFTTPSYSPKLWDWKTQQGKISSSLSRRQVPHPHIKILDRFVFLKFTFKVSYMSRKGKVSPLQNSADFK